MALTISIEGLGVIANADAETNDTGGTGTGDWGFTGSGGVSNGLTTDTFYFGDSSIAMALSGAGKNGWLYFDRGSGNEIDFDTAGNEEGQHIYIWVHCPTIGLSETLANIGLGIRIGSSTTDYRTFTVAGNDDSNGWDGAWKCFVIDPTKTGSVTDTGTFDVGAVRYIGIKGETTATAKGDNFFVSQIAVGSGLRVTGTSTTGWLDAVNYCTDLVNRAWGMLQEREGIFYQYGTVTIGDATSQSAAVSFTDSARVIQYGLSEYYISSAWETSADVDYSGLVIEDHSSWTTTFKDGVIVGTDNGRSGSTIIGNANHDVSVDFYGGNNAGSVTALYGTVLSQLTGTLVAGDDADHEMFGVSFIACSQFDPVGAVEMRNCVFAETVDATSALLWNSSMDIADCSFIANTTGAGIEHTECSAVAYSYDNLLFSGNTDDIENSDNAATINAGSFVVDRAYKILVAGTTDFTAIGAADNNVGTKFVAEGVGSGTGTATEVLLIASVNGANPSQAKINNSGTNSDGLVLNAVTVTVTVLDATTGLAVSDARVWIGKDSDKSELHNSGVNASGVTSFPYSYMADLDIVGWAREMSLSGIDYVQKDFAGTIGVNGFSIVLQLEQL